MRLRVWAGVLGLGLVLAGVARAQTVMPQGGGAVDPVAGAVKPSPNLAGIAHVALRVKDLSASVAFYEKLGFVKAFELSRDGAVYEAFIKINDRQFLELYPVDAKNTHVGFLHVCFEGDNLQAVHDYYVAHGLKPNDVRKAGAGNLLFTMPGPDTPQGPQNMEYTQYMPGSLHSKDVGQHLGRDRIGKSLEKVWIGGTDLQAARAFYIDKAGFQAIGPISLLGTSGDGFQVGIPGSSTEAVVFWPASTLGGRAQIALGTEKLPEVKDLVQQFSPKQFSADGYFLDPDGNWILLQLLAPAK